MDLRLGRSVVELVIRVRVVSGSIPGPAMYFHCLYAHPSIHTTDGAVTSQYCDGLRLMSIARKATPT